MQEYADVMLPISPFTETDGTFVNAEGRWQGFSATVPCAGEARPAWKVLRVMGNMLGLDGFEYVSIDEIRQEIRRAAGDAVPSNDVEWSVPAALNSDDRWGVVRVGHVALYGTDNIVRRSEPLQQTGDARDSAAVRVPGVLARRLGLEGASRVAVKQGDGRAEMPLIIDDRVPAGCVLIPAGIPDARSLGPLFGAVTLEPVGR
jgi:NADH-quinone oxidoreductase subunit G